MITIGLGGGATAACVVLSIWLAWRVYDGVADTRALIRHWRRRRQRRHTLRITSSQAPWASKGGEQDRETLTAGMP